MVTDLIIVVMVCYCRIDEVVEKLEISSMLVKSINLKKDNPEIDKARTISRGISPFLHPAPGISHLPHIDLGLAHLQLQAQATALQRGLRLNSPTCSHQLSCELFKRHQNCIYGGPLKCKDQKPNIS